MAIKTDDTLSLTLPKALSRSRRKRRQRPPLLFWIQLAVCIAAICFAVSDYLNGYYLLAAAQTWTAIAAWKVAICAKDRRPIHPGWGISMVANLALLLTFAIAGVS